MSQINVSRRRNKVDRTELRRAARYLAACVEKLEERTLLSGIVGTTGMKSATLDGFQAVGAVYDTNGALWMSAIDAIDGAEVGVAGPGNTFTPVYTDANAVEFDGLVAGPNGTLYFINLAANSIMKYDPSVAVVQDRVSTLWASVPNALQQITGLTVSGSDVWFYMNSTSDNTQYGHVNMIGRVDPSGSMTPLTLSGDAVLQYTDVVGLSATHLEIASNVFVNGVYVGFKGIDATATHPNQVPAAPVGQSAVGVAYLSGASIAFSYAVPTGSDPLYRYGELTSIATDPRDGSVWFAMGPGVPSQKPEHPASAIVHGTLNATWDGFADLAPYTVKGATTGDNMRLMSLAFDGNGDLYFVEYAKAKVGFLDTNIVATVSDVSTAYSVSGLQDLVTDPGDLLTPPTIENTTLPIVVAVNPMLPATTGDVAATVVAGTGYTWLSVHANIVVVTPPEVEFSGSAGAATPLSEDHLYTQLPIAAFTAPTGNYVAIIHWGDGTPDVTVPVTLVTDNVYAVNVDKKFAVQSPAGGFAGTVTIHETSNAQPDHVLTMSTVVTDTPLAITDFSISTLLSRIATLTMTFTDDVDSRANNFDVSVNWGDGSTSKGVVLKDQTTAGRYFVLAIHVYKKKGTYNVTATVTGTEEGLAEMATRSQTLVLA